MKVHVELLLPKEHSSGGCCSSPLTTWNTGESQYLLSKLVVRALSIKVSSSLPLISSVTWVVVQDLTQTLSL